MNFVKKVGIIEADYFCFFQIGLIFEEIFTTN